MKRKHSENITHNKIHIFHFITKIHATCIVLMISNRFQTSNSYEIQQIPN